MFALLWCVEAYATGKNSKPSPADKGKYQQAVNQTLNGEQFLFKPNNGNWQSEIKYRTYQQNQNVSFLDDRISFGKRLLQGDPMLAEDAGNQVNTRFTSWDIEFTGKSSTSKIVATEMEDRNISYFGPNQTTATRILEYKKLSYVNLYHNTDLIFYTDKKFRLKYDFVLRPGAVIDDIQLKYNGVNDVKICRDGKLLIRTPFGSFKEDKPLAWQVINGIKKLVEVKYTLKNKVVGFECTNYNRDYELIIDPIYLDWSSYFYGEGVNSSSTFTWSWVLDIDIDFNDQVYVTGMTTDWFPYFPNAYDTSLNGYYDAFICKMNAKGDSMKYFSYFGGNSYEYALSMTVNQNEEPVISGITYSRDFPVTKNAFDTSTRNCGSSTWCLTGFVTKFNKTSTALIYSTFLGGDNYSSGWNIDWIRGMTMNSAGEVYLVGNTNSSDFPVTSGAYQTTFKGGTSSSYYLQGDAFLTKIKSDGSGLVFSTFIGGTGGDVAYDVILSSKEEVYVVGYTASSNFPTTPGSKIFNTFIKGPSDAWFAKFKPDGSNVIYSKLMGGSGDDIFEGLYINDQDELFVGGYSNSTDFYVTSNAYQKNNKGGYDFVVVKILSSGTNVTYSTYLGGSKNEYIYNYPYFSTIKIAANVREEAVICGITASNDFPITSDALQTVNKTQSWGFGGTLCIAKLSMNGDKVLYGSYFGGSRIEYPGGIRVKRTGCVTNIVFGGLTQSVDYPTTKGSWRDSAKKSNFGWIYSGFVSKFRDTLKTDLIELSLQDTIIECDKVFEILDASNQGADFRWSHGPKTRYVILQNPGMYWVEATYGCDTVRDTINIKLEYSPVVPVLRSDTLFCNGFVPVLLDAKNDTIKRSYLWSTADTTQTILAKDSGLYIVQISTPNCGSKSDSVYLKKLNSPVINLPSDTIYCDSVRMVLNVTGKNEECTFKWSNTDTTANTKLNTPGKYWVTAENLCGKASDTIHVALLYSPEAQLPADTLFCDAFAYRIKTGRQNNAESYNWSELLSSTSMGTNDSLWISFAGVYKIDVSNICGLSSDTFTAKNHVSPSVNLKDTTYDCFTVNNIFKVGKANNGETYIWSTSDTTASVTISKPGVFWVAISNECNIATDTGLIILKQAPTVNLPADSIFCNTINYTIYAAINDDEAIYYWNGTPGADTYTVNKQETVRLKIENRCGIVWDSASFSYYTTPTVNLGGDKVFCGTINPVSYTIGKPLNGETYNWQNGSTLPDFTATSAGWVKASVSNKCGIAVDSAFLKVSAYPVVNLGPDTILCGNFRLLLDAGADGTTWLWNTGETTRTIIANEQKLYFVEVTNADGCKSKDEYKIGNNCESFYFIPSSFTPNNDGLNDTFIPSLINFEEYTLQIYNRWGQKLFETHNPLQGWDGTFMEKRCDAGNYFYIINLVTTEDMQPRQFKGPVTLLR